MALISCPECQTSISDKAAACPRCGHPIAGGVQYVASGDPKALLGSQKKRSGCGGIVLFGILAVIVLSTINSNDSKDSKEKKAEAPACASDWRLCSDVSDLVNHYSEISRAQVDCKFDAEKLAKYGTPKWPWFSFSSFYPHSSIKNGIVTLVEPDAQFSNGFGAMVHSTVRCNYDLDRKQVVNVTIDAN